MDQAPKFIVVDGQRGTRDFRAEMFNRSPPVCWPMDGAFHAIHPSQVAEANAQLRALDVKKNVFYERDGELKVGSRAGYNDWQRRTGRRNNDAGWGDWSGTDGKADLEILERLAYANRRT
jgi:hypothetical protein